jgi:hypothetical protein
VRKVFWAEGDDDAIQIEGADAPKRSLIAYLLLDLPVVVHPAYVWQSEQTHDLILADTGGLLSPANINLVLGDSCSINEYIHERKLKLKENLASADFNNSSTIELRQYEAYGERLGEESDILDDRFSWSNGVYEIDWSRDKKFRNKVESELVGKSRQGNELYGLLLRNRGGTSERDVNYCIALILEIVRGNLKLASVDSILSILIQRKYAPENIFLIANRLHLIHWMSNSGDDLHVPLLSRLDEILDPIDPDVFWTAIRYLIGGEMEKIMLRHSWTEVSRAILDMKQDIVWIKFVEQYHEIVAFVNSSNKQFEISEIISGLGSRYTTIWREIKKTPIGRLGSFSLLCSVIGSSLGGPILGGFFSLAGIALTLSDMTKRWLGAASRVLNDGDLNILRVRVQGTLAGIEEGRYEIETHNNDDLLVQDISILELDIAILNRLRSNRIDKVGQLLAHTVKEVGAIKGIGAKRLFQIRTALGHFGLKLSLSE